MSYESRIFIVERHEHKTWVYGNEIARFDLCKMGYYMFDGKSFRDLFKKEIDFDLNINVEDKEHYDIPKIIELIHMVHIVNIRILKR